MRTSWKTVFCSIDIIIMLIMQSCWTPNLYHVIYDCWIINRRRLLTTRSLPSSIHVLLTHTNARIDLFRPNARVAIRWWLHQHLNLFHFSTSYYFFDSLHSFPFFTLLSSFSIFFSVFYISFFLNFLSIRYAIMLEEKTKVNYEYFATGVIVVLVMMLFSGIEKCYYNWKIMFLRLHHLRSLL